MLPGGPTTIFGEMAERVDPFSEIRRTVWETYPDPIWHLRIAGPWARANDRFKPQRDSALARLPRLLPFAERQWATEQRVLGIAALRRITLKQEAGPPRPGHRPLTADERAEFLIALGISGATAWGAIEQRSVPVAAGAGLALAELARRWHKLRSARRIN